MPLGLSLILMDRCHLRFVESLVRRWGSDRSPPAAILSNHLGYLRRYAIGRPARAAVGGN